MSAIDLTVEKGDLGERIDILFLWVRWDPFVTIILWNIDMSSATNT